jgi:alanine racemase
MWRATVRINLDAIRHNYQHAKALAPQSKTVAVIKADAYGHGVLPIATALCHDNVDALAVANVYEGVKLRQGGISHPHIVILQGANGSSQWQDVLSHNLTPMIHNPDQMDHCLNNWPSTRSIWIKVDTGMHRLGLSPSSSSPLDSFLQQSLQKFPKENIVLCSHFACSDEVGLEFNQEQLDVLTKIRQKHDLQWSMANSGAIMSFPSAHGTWNRAGFMLYGNTPLSAPHPSDLNLKPVMNFSAPIIAIREVPAGESVGYSRKWYAPSSSPSSSSPVTRIATVAVGYADGYPRHARNGTPVVIHNQRAALAGRVSMDMITVEVTNIPNVKIGDEVCLWGDGLSVNEVAASADTIGYELLTKVTSRPMREYHSSLLLQD